MAYNEQNDPAKAYTLETFISMKYQDDLTYRNFSILEVLDGIELTDHCVIDEYLDELSALCVEVELTAEEYAKYKYSPDLMSYDVYGTTQLDFVILMANDMVDPKEFDSKKPNDTNKKEKTQSAKLSYKQSKILEEYPALIEALEIRIKELNKALSTPEIYQEVGIQTLFEELEEKKGDLYNMENEYYEVLSIAENLK